MIKTTAYGIEKARIANPHQRGNRLITIKLLGGR